MLVLFVESFSRGFRPTWHIIWHVNCTTYHVSMQQQQWRPPSGTTPMWTPLMCCKSLHFSKFEDFTLWEQRNCCKRGGSSASCQGPECSINFLRGSFKRNGSICIISMHCSLQIKTGHGTQCKSCCDRNVTFKYQEFQCNSCIHFAIKRINIELCTWLYNKC
jgi:hypothetical protein